MKKLVTKTGNFLLCMVPVLISVFLQLSAVIAYFLLAGIYIALTQPGYGDTVSTAEVTRLLEDNVIVSVFLYQIIGLLIFALWYYFIYGKQKTFQDRERPGMKAILIILAVGVLYQFFTSSILGLIDTFSPEALKSYTEMMEQSGLTEVSVLAVVCTVLLAPIGEELLCRGVIFRLAKRVSTKFFIANIIQAFAFGVLHMNLVQGTYAFVFGLILGYLYGKYRNIFLCMLLHASLNASSFLMDPVWSGISDGLMAPVLFIVVFLSGALLVLCYLGLGKIRPLQGDGVSFPAVKAMRETIDFS